MKLKKWDEMPDYMKKDEIRSYYNFLKKNSII